MRYLLSCLIITKACLVFSQSASIDETFNLGGAGANLLIHSTYVQDDGKIMIGGWFYGYNNQPQAKLARLLPNGTLDEAFVPEISGNNDVYRIAPDDNNKVIVSFIATNNGLIRLNADGSLDEEFSSNIGSGPDNTVFAIAKQSDGKILIGGAFTTFNARPLKYLIRLNTNGTVDATFNPILDFHVRYIVLLDNGEMILGDSYQAPMTKLHADGTKDIAFHTGVFASETGEPWITGMIKQSNGKVLIGGFFKSYDGTLKKNLLRINSDGSIDNTFNATLNGTVRCLIPIGNHTVVQVDDATKRMVVIDVDGSIHSSFEDNQDLLLVLDGFFHQGKLLIVGLFNTFLDAPVGNITRLYVDLDKSSQTINFPEIAVKTYGGPEFIMQASASSSLEVKFKSSDESLLKIAGNKATIVGIGTVTVTASEEGDVNYLPADPVKRTVIINKANQNISFNPIPELTLDDAEVDLVASSTSGLNMYYRSSDSSIAIVEGNKALIKGEGETTITAYQDGNENFNEAFPVSKILKVKLITGTEIANFPSYKIYPNPVATHIFLHCASLPNDKVSYTLYNVANAVVSYGDLTSCNEDVASIDMVQCPKGVYFLFIKSGNNNSFHKIIKM